MRTTASVLAILIGLCWATQLSDAFESNAVYQRTPVVYAPINTFLDQGWTSAERIQFNHLSGGTYLLPYNWYTLLEQSDTPALFNSDFNIAQFRLIPDPNYAAAPDNPDRIPLPVGLAKTSVPGRGTFVGMTCAFCHTGQLNYTKRDSAGQIHQRYTIYIDGGASLQYNFRFLRGLLMALRVTLADTTKFARFASQVWTKDCQGGMIKGANKADCTKLPPPDYQKSLYEQVASATAELLRRSRIDVVEWGFGRFDALGRGGSLVFSTLDTDNLRPSSAPVSIPQLWNAWRYDRVQWSGAIQHPLARNVGQVIGVGAGLEFKDANDPFKSTLELENLEKIEDQFMRKLRPPRWPENILGRIDETLAATGKQLYYNRCQHCHVPIELSPVNDDDRKFRQRFHQHLHVTLIPIEEIGTDPTYLDSFLDRQVKTGVLRQRIDKDADSAAAMTQYLTTEILKRYERATKQDLYSPHNVWIGNREYLARPHPGVWATAPFLHNGSVPTLYALLSPLEERNQWARCFYLGDLEFDPVHVGFLLRPCDGLSRPENFSSGFEFETTKPGNSNAGHEFRRTDRTGQTFSDDQCAHFNSKGRTDGIIGCYLEPAARLALIEYLKTCDLEFLWEQRYQNKAKEFWSRPPELCRAAPAPVTRE